jgi:hypothetical protein
MLTYLGLVANYVFMMSSEIVFGTSWMLAMKQVEVS